MKLSRDVAARRGRYPFIGASIWILSIQYFLVQLIVARAWTLPYSVAHNTISDLGNTACGIYSGNFVCSPQHGIMNASFILLGIGMSAGSILVYQAFKKSPASLIGFSCMAIAGLGTILVGLFPENRQPNLHELGAALPFLLGNVGMVVLGFGLPIPRVLRVYTVASGLVALVALGCFVSHSYLGIGEGGMERITAYPQTLWLIIFGGYIVKQYRLRFAS